MSRGKRTRLIYTNCKIFSPDNRLLCFCDQSRINWYLNNNLADIIPDQEYLSIRLKFEPVGNGSASDLFGVTPKENKCVVCGEEEISILTRHHIVPVIYMKYFPIKIKTRNHHEVLALCKDCHGSYEIIAEEIKTKLAEPYKQETDYMFVRAVKNAKALKKHGNKIPEDKKIKLLSIIKYHFGKDDITQEDILELSKVHRADANSYHGKEVVENLTDIVEFIKMWRKHFVDTMQPKFLPKGWNIDRPINY